MQFARDALVLLTPPGQPYSAAELQSKFANTSPRAAYTLLCKRCGCKPIPAVGSMFPDQARSWTSVTELDLSKTYVGPRGAMPLIEMCKLCPGVTKIDLSDNYLTNESVWHLCKMALFHPALASINLSRNPLLSWTAAMCMVELANKNVHISSVSLLNTSMPPELVDAIGNQVLRNASIGTRKTRRGLNPCNHPTTIRQRALKRYFMDLTGKRETVHRSRLADGLKEMWKISGREREITQRTPLFYENFNKRATSDEVGWEEFLILIMLEDVLYHANYVERIRNVFQQFDVDDGGYVEVRELANMITHLSPTLASPKPEEVRSKMEYYDLDENMTLTWDEFLLLLYDHGPVVGSKAELIATPLSQLPHAHHN